MHQTARTHPIMTTPDSHFDLPRTTLAVLFTVGILSAALWILRPFIPALIWATMVVVATWPLMLMVQQRLWGRRWLAVVVMTIAMLLVFVVPLVLALEAIVSNADEMTDWVKSLATVTLPQPPEWLHRTPFAGEGAATMWREIADSGPKELAKKIAPYAQDAARWFAAEVGSFGLVAVQFLLTVIISAILYARGEVAASGLRGFFERLGGPYGRNAVVLAGQAIRGVA